MIIIVIGAGILVYKPKKDAVIHTFSLATAPVKMKHEYQIISSTTHEFKNVVSLEALIQDKITLDEMIEIAYDERVLRGGTALVQVRFRYFSENNNYYGSAGYLVDCSDCQQLDPKGDPISADIFYKEAAVSKTINDFPKGIAPKDVIARFYDHGWQQNALIAYTDKRKSQASYFMLYPENKQSEIKLKPINEYTFKVIDTGAKYRVLKDRVEYIQTNGTISYTYPRVNIDIQ